jgi:two-component system cell cycle sensor histidine kinase/response regulator CckA
MVSQSLLKTYNHTGNFSQNLFFMVLFNKLDFWTMKAAQPDYKTARLEALGKNRMLDTAPEEAFDNLTRLAAQICETPIALMMLIDGNQQCIKSKFGLKAIEASREIAFCTQAYLFQEVVIVEETLADERFVTNPFVISDPHIRFYASLPLITSGGEIVGTICVLDYLPRSLKASQLEALQTLSRQAIKQLELQQKLEELATLRWREYKEIEAKLQHREQELLDFFENGTIGLHCVDANGIIIWANQAELDLFGYTPEEYIGQNIAKFYCDKAVLDDILARLNANETLENYEARLLCKDGSIRYVLINSNVRWENGKFSYTRCYTRDITERKQAEQELRELSTALENAVEGISRLDTMGRYLAVNKAYASTVGYQPEEMIGMQWEPTVHPEDLEKLNAAYQQMLIDGKVEVEARGIRKDGAIFYKRIVMISAYDEQQQFTGHHCFMKDISARKHIEEKIREQAALLEITTDAISVRDLHQNILFWNKGAERLYGWKAEEVLGENALEILYKNTTLPQQEIQASLEKKGSWQGELNKLTKDGKKIIVESRWTLVKNNQGQPKSILVVSTDITHKKQLEAQFLRTQRMESIGTLAGGIAHDLNNVFAPILMAIQLLQLKLKDSQSQQWLDILESSAQRGADLVKQVVSFARGVEGERTLIQVRHLIKEIKQIAIETFPKSIAVDIDVPEDLWTVSGDATQLHQVLMNLCVNARDAMLDGGNLNISGKNILIDENYAQINIDAKVGPYIVITVSDTGTGISQEILERIFEPFFTTKEVGKGTGLGLSTVIGIIKSHAGFVNVYSELGQGTEFKVYLPALAETVTQSVKAQKLIEGEGELILVVDDEEPILKITSNSLETHGYRVLTANDGIEAIALYAEYGEEISTVIVDMMMPSMDGPTTINLLQKMNPAVKIIAVSGLVSSNKVNLATNSGIKALLNKPYSTNELLETIREVVKSGC